LNENYPTEYSTGRGVERMPDGKQRPLTDRERARIERTAGLRDQARAEVEDEVRRGR
jgi:hypothetical protein